MERRKLLETARSRWNPLESAGTAEDPPLRTLQCRPRHPDTWVWGAGASGRTSGCRSAEARKPRGPELGRASTRDR
eukprot:13370996-Alexandrium_andersonii.AAC.1